MRADRNPYVGPRAFQRTQAHNFYGRERERHDLRDRVIVSKVLLVYGPSGSGKTSLLYAGLIPLLEEEDLEILPVVRLGAPLPPAILERESSNIYVLSTLLSWSRDELAPQDLAVMTLSDFLARREVRLDSLGHPMSPVALFDQFEELITAYPARWQEREAFFHQLRDALRTVEDLRVVLLMREEYLAALDPYASLLPGGLRERYRVELLRPPAALEAVRRPSAAAGVTFAPEAAELLVADLRRIRTMDPSGGTVSILGEYVEPVQLQVVCRRLWDNLPANAQLISREHVMASEDVDQALTDLYEETVLQAVNQTGVSEDMLRRWFDDALITPAGTRGIVFRDQENTAGIPNETVDVLASRYLIRGELRAGARWYELTHDRFITPIQDANRRWWSQQPGTNLAESEHGRESLGSRLSRWRKRGGEA